MNKKMIAILTAALLMGRLTACHTENTAPLSSEMQSTETAISLMEAATSQWLITAKAQPTAVHLAGNKIFWSYGEPFSMKVDGFDMETGTALTAPFSSPAGEDALAAIIPNSITVSEGNIVFTYRIQRIDEANEWLGNAYYQDTYAPSMELLERKELFATDEADAAFDKFCPDGNGGWYATKFVDGSEQIILLDSAFQQTGTITGSVLYADALYPMADGRVYVRYHEEMGGSGIPQLGVFDAESMHLTPVSPSGMPQTLRGVCSDGQTMYVFDTKGIYAVSDTACTMVVDFLTANFNGSSVTSVNALADGSFVLGTANADYSETEFWHLERAEPNPEVQTIVLAGRLFNDDVTNAVNRYNRANSDYRIEIKDYSADGSEDMGQAAFEADLLAGDLPDMIYWNGLSFEKIARKGICEDLRPYMEEEGCFTDEQYFMNFFESMEYEEQMLRIGFSFSIDTLAGKTEFVGEGQGLDYAAFREMMLARPEGMDLFRDMNSSWAISYLCVPSLSQFMDTKTAECRFDSPEFIELLRIGEGYPSFDELMLYEQALTDEERLVYFENRRNQFRNNAVLFHHNSISDPYQWHYISAGEFGGAPVTFVGYPTSTGNGGRFLVYDQISMVSSSEHKEQIWDFILSMLSESSQKSLIGGLPVHRGVMDERMQAAMSPLPEDQSGYPRSWMDQDGVHPIGDATQAEMDAFLAYVEGIRSCNDTDPAVLNIFWEEADMYLAGDQTPEQAAKNIQSRVSLYLSEQS